MTAWEHQALNEAVVQRSDTLEYFWPGEQEGEMTNTRYEIDLLAMTQTNTSNNKVRPVLYLADDTAQSVTSPFHEGLRVR